MLSVHSKNIYHPFMRIFTTLLSLWKNCHIPFHKFKHMWLKYNIYTILVERK
jgi:hypothetical protein